MPDGPRRPGCSTSASIRAVHVDPEEVVAVSGEPAHEHEPGAADSNVGATSTTEPEVSRPLVAPVTSHHQHVRRGGAQAGVGDGRGRRCPTAASPAAPAPAARSRLASHARSSRAVTHLGRPANKTAARESHAGLETVWDGDPASRRKLGLSREEAARRLAERGPFEPPATSRSYGSIVRANVFTVFNLILAVFGALTLAFGDWQDALFLGVLVSRTRESGSSRRWAKRALDRLAASSPPPRPSSAAASRSAWASRTSSSGISSASRPETSSSPTAARGGPAGCGSTSRS